MPEIEGVLFDLDGTLVDSERVHLDAWNRTLSEYGLDLPEGWNEEAVGIPDILTAERIARRFPGMPGGAVLHERKQDLYRRLVRECGPGIAYPGVAERVRTLRDRGIGMAVGTNSGRENTEAALEAAGILGFFPVRVTYDSVANGKPDPEIYATAARLLGLPPDRCVVVEDSVAGVTSGKAAGCLTLGVSTTWTASVLADADKVFADTPAALDWVLERARKGAPHE